MKLKFFDTRWTNSIEIKVKPKHIKIVIQKPNLFIQKSLYGTVITFIIFLLILPNWSKYKWNKDLLNDISEVMSNASICGLGQAASNPILSVLKFFPEDVGIK